MNNTWKEKIKCKGLGIAPQEASDNLETPELGRDSRFTGRTKQLGLRVKPDFAKRLKVLAAEEDCLLVEILEKALECYEETKHIKIIPPKIKPKKLSPYFPLNFICDSCGDEYERDTAYSYASSLREINRYQTYCGGCVE
jgi:hypothetical protein